MLCNMANSYPRQPDRSRPNVQIHEIVDDATLKVILDAVDDDLLAHVHELEVGVFVLITIAVNGLVNLLVHLDAIAEVLRRILGILTAVVRASRLDITNVGHDEILVIALALDKDDLDAMTGASLQHPLATLLCRVGSIKDTDNTTGPEPGEHVGNSGLGSLASFPLTLRVVHVKEVGSGLRGIIATVVADIEDLGRNRQPLQISLC